MIHVLSKILGRKKNESPSPRMKEGPTLWQKASSSLRQSLRHAKKSGHEFSNLSPGEKLATLSGSQNLQRESQRNVARERRSLAAKMVSNDDVAAAKRSLYSRSLCMSEDWDTQPLTTKLSRSPRKLTKDSGYETSAQCDPDYAISLSDPLTKENTPDGSVKSKPILPDKPDIRRRENNRTKGNNSERLEWNTRHRPLSFSHQEVTSESVKQHRQLRHSCSQREVSRHSRQSSVDSLDSSIDLKKSCTTSVESGSAWSSKIPTVTKSTPHLAQARTQRHSSSSDSLLPSDVDDIGSNSMVTRRFKKGSVYDTLASTSGLDFSPVVQLKTYNSRRDDSSPQIQIPKPSEKSKEKSTKIFHEICPVKDKEEENFNDESKTECTNVSQSTLNMNLPQNLPENKQVAPNANCIAAHEKYPSWPVVSEPWSVSHRSHSWTEQTDYPKEKISYSRPKKDHQFKISTNQLQPVLERTSDYCNSSKTSQDGVSGYDRNQNGESYQLAFPSCSNSFKDCNGKQFDFEAFHTPCIPQFYEDKDFLTHSPPERDGSSSSSILKTQNESIINDSSGFSGRYEDVFHHHEAQFLPPLSARNKLRTIESKGDQVSPDTPFLDRLRMDNAWHLPPPTIPIQPAVSPLQQQQLQHPQEQQQGNDFEVSSENGTWMGSMESSTHERIIPKWQGSYSDVSTLSTQFSNRSSMFDSGHSTMPESGRLSPQSSCDSTATSLLLEGPTRAQVVARHGCHREIVAHSARVQPPERHGSESVLYYTTGSSSRPKSCDNNLKSSPKNGKTFSDESNMAAEKTLFRSHASVTLSPSISKSNSREFNERANKTPKCPKRQNSRSSSNSVSDDSYLRPRYAISDDTSGSSSDVSNITCISNYKDAVCVKPYIKSLEKSMPVTDSAKPQTLDQSFLDYKLGYQPAKSKSMDETSQKTVFSENDKRQRISDPELKAIQKQAVMSFYQRMSLAESIKSDSKPDTEPPPPYEARSPIKIRICAPKLSLLPNKTKQLPPPNCSTEISQQKNVPGKASDPGLLRNYSKSVPNLVRLKGQSLDLPPSHPFFKQAYNAGQHKENTVQHIQPEKTRGSPLAKDEIISWDQLPSVLEKKREAIEKATPSSETKDPPEDNGGCTSSQNYLKAHKSPRKVQLKEVHHSNETASVQVMTPEGVTLVQTNEKKIHKRRPAPPPPPKQPPRRPPPPPPPVTPPLTQVIVESNGDLDLPFDFSSNNSKTPPGDRMCPSSPDLPLPPPPTAEEVMIMCDDPLPPPPDSSDNDVHPRTLDSTSLIYPKNSYMSYRSERKLARQGFDGKYRRSFSTSVDLATIDFNTQDENVTFSPNSWEQMHNIRQHGTTVIFHSDSLQQIDRLQKSSSQNCILLEENRQNCSDPVSKGSDVINNQLSSTVKQNNDSEDTLHWAMPYHVPSHERVNFEIQNSSDSHQATNGVISVCPDSVLKPIPVNDSCDNHLSDISSQKSDSESVDHNQNSLKTNKVEKNVTEILNGNDLVNQINSSDHKIVAPRLRRQIVKTKEELECERLSRDFIRHYGNEELKNLLVPAPNHKTLSDYMDGLLNLDLENNLFNQENSLGCVGRLENIPRDETCVNDESCFLESEAKGTEGNDNQNVDSKAELKKRKDELITSVEKKLESLRVEQINIRAEMLHNNLLGQEVSDQLRELAKPYEAEKYSLHMEEQEKIVNLLLSLSGRLARAENNLRNIPKDCGIEEKKILESKRNKLKEQHEDACRLKDCIDRRSNQVITFLHKYLSDEEYAKYDHFIKRKTKFLIDIREIDEKINLGEEQLAALNVVAQLWKSANSSG